MDQTIVLDGSPMGGGISGAGRYAFHLINNLLSLESSYHYHIVAPSDDSPWDFSGWRERENVTLTSADIRGAGPGRQWYYLRHRFEYDLFHSLSSYLPLGVRGPSVVTIHDLKQFRSDLFYTGLDRLKWAYIRTMISSSVCWADSIISVSEFTKSDIIDHFGTDRSRVTAVPLGPVTLPASPDGPPPVNSPYFLFVGELRPHKNLPTLLEAFALFYEQTETDIQLVVAGRHYGSANLLSGMDPKHRENVHLLGEVDDETLATLYKGALAYVFPSLYEGFGLPILEAMQFGTPVIVSDRTSLPEVAGEAGLYVDPTDPVDISEKLETIATEEEVRQDYSTRARERFGDFSWERTARETLKVYDSMLQ